MPKTTLTINDVTDISRARHIRQHHQPTRRRWRKVCAECGHRWGRYGCAQHLWATDYLSQYSVILVPDRPPRPPHRHRPAYIMKLNRAKLEQAKTRIRQSVRVHGSTRPLPHPA